MQHLVRHFLVPLLRFRSRVADVERMIVCVARRFTVDATACLPTHVLQVRQGRIMNDSGVLASTHQYAHEVRGMM